MYFHGITTIIFDLDGTLRYSYPYFGDVYASTAMMLGAPEGEENRLRAERWSADYFTQQADRDIRKYRWDWEIFWNAYGIQYVQVLGCSEEMACKIVPELRSIMSETYQSEDIVPDDVIPTLAALREAGYRIGIVTNRVALIDNYLKEKGLAPYMDFCFTAGEVGYCKPHPAIFQHALAAVRAKPEQTICVGDNWYADIAGARDAGISAVMIDRRQLFLDADCPVIQSIGELKPMLLPR